MAPAFLQEALPFLSLCLFPPIAEDAGVSDLSSAGRITALSPVSISEADIYWNSVQDIREDLDVLLEQSHSFPFLKAHFPGV